MKDKLSVSIVIPSWNGRMLLEKHLPSVIKAAKGNEIIVVDDCSTDDSVEFIKNNYLQIKVIQKRVHEGFSSTVNEGVHHASGEIIVLLNTDIEPEENFLKPLLIHFLDDSVFAVGCMDKSIEQGKVVLRGRAEAFWSKGMFMHRRGEVNMHDTAWVSGGSGAFKKKYWIQLGGMDELFNPFYWEDIDLSYRAIKSGFKMVFEPRSIVIHNHEKGVIKTTAKKEYIKRIAYRNQLLCIWKNITDYSYLVDHVIHVHVRFIWSLIKGDKAFVFAYFDGILLLPAVLKKRKQVQKTFIKSDREILPRYSS
jgi:GT2 family glycosyltransferase